MLHLHFANHTESLAALLLAQLDGPRDDPFTPDTVVVPSAALQRWLTLAIARQQGVCAHTRFLYLGPWLWEQLARLRPDAPGSQPLSADAQAWRVYRQFGDAAFLASQPRLAHYLAGADALMRFELAQQLAPMLEQISTYRPDWLLAWREGRPSSPQPLPDEAWQAALWRRLDDGLGDGPRGGGQAIADCTRWLATPAGAARAAQAGLPQRVHVFALPTLPPLHLALLQQLAHWVDVQVYALNPCAEYWFDVVDAKRLARLALQGKAQHSEVGHPLLASWGAQAQATLGQLVDAAGDSVVDDERHAEPDGHHLLAQLQSALLHLQPMAPGSVTLAPDDRSIELHVCHGRLRELEVLQDRLLALMAGPNPPRPEDILVVTPDLEATAPLVDAVFGTAPPERSLPYRLTGLAASQASAPARALLDALALAAGRLEASAVMALLQQPVVARRFGLDEAALALVHGWLREAGVHWALDGEHRAALGLPADARHSWTDGLARLFAGHALPRVVSQPWAGLLPAGDAEGSDAQHLGALWRCVQALATLTRATTQPLPPARWPALLAQTTAALVSPADEDLEPLRELHAAFDALGQQWADAGLDEPLPLAVVTAALTALLDDPARGGVPTGAITFSALPSLRSLPFRVVCVLGLDDGAFPSAGRAPEFDLIAAAPRPGDRQRRLDERNLFLDLLGAAREVLHLSHTGRSARDNSPLPPSVLVAELLDQLIPTLDLPPDQARARLVVEHPLQAFAETAFHTDADPRLRSHQAEYAQALRAAAAARAPVLSAPVAAPNPAAHAGAAALTDDATLDEDDNATDSGADAPALAPFFTAPLPAPGPEWRQLNLAQLLAFFRHPARFLLRQRLGLHLVQPEDELQDDEPFLPDWPARQALAARLLPPLLAGVPAAQVQALAEAGGELPAGALGAQALANELQQLSQHAQRVRAATASPCLPPLSVALTLAVGGQSWQLAAGLADLRPEGLVRHRADDRRPTDHLEAWLHHLVLCAAAPAGVAPVTTWLMRDGLIRLRPCAEPQARLAELLQLMAQGLSAPLPFFPKTCWDYVAADRDPRAAALRWTPSAQVPHTEGADPANRLVWRGRTDPVLQDDGRMDHAAVTVYGPLFEHLEGDAP